MQQSSDARTDRRAEIDAVIDHVTAWAAGRGDVVGLLLVGSVARNEARPDSDVDLMLLVTDPDRYRAGTWTASLGLGQPALMRTWGVITERRFIIASGLEVELNVGAADWARTEPCDPGTRRVVTDGARILHDPSGILRDLLHALQAL